MSNKKERSIGTVDNEVSALARLALGENFLSGREIRPCLHGVGDPGLVG